MVVRSQICNLFITEDVTGQVDSLMESVPNDIETFKAMLDAAVEPNVLIGEQSNKPYPCPFKAYCWEAVPEKSIFTIPRLSKKKRVDRRRYLARIRPFLRFLTQLIVQAYVNYVSEGFDRSIKGKLSYPIKTLLVMFETDNLCPR